MGTSIFGLTGPVAAVVEAPRTETEGETTAGMTGDAVAEPSFADFIRSSLRGVGSWSCSVLPELLRSSSSSAGVRRLDVVMYRFMIASVGIVVG